ncbi:MAG: hypothetical protein ACLR6B_19970 [Blautia sp.]
MASPYLSFFSEDDSSILHLTDTQKKLLEASSNLTQKQQDALIDLLKPLLKGYAETKTAWPIFSLHTFHKQPESTLLNPRMKTNLFPYLSKVERQVFAALPFSLSIWQWLFCFFPETLISPLTHFINQHYFLFLFPANLQFTYLTHCISPLLYHQPLSLELFQRNNCLQKVVSPH